MYLYCIDRYNDKKTKQCLNFPFRSKNYFHSVKTTFGMLRQNPCGNSYNANNQMLLKRFTLSTEPVSIHGRGDKTKHGLALPTGIMVSPQNTAY